jgi:transposase
MMVIENPINLKQEETTMKITTVGLDLAKNVFHAVCFDEHSKEVKKRMLRRNQLRLFFTQLPPCKVGMEACASSHYWGRELKALGHDVKLIPAQHVKPYLLGNKNDFNDARAIAEALTRPQIRGVALKTTEQQDIQATHRMRSQCLRDRTALCNSVRGLLAEYGIVLGKGIAILRKSIHGLLEDASNGLSLLFRNLLARRYEQLVELDGHIDFFTHELETQSRQDDACQRLQDIPGYGPIVASAFYSAVGNGEGYSRGRDVAASLGLVPGQHSTGGKNVLLGISKRGDGYLRGLLIHGARSVVIHAIKKKDKLSQWINRIVAERGKNKAAVAVANKMARIGWAILRHNDQYQTALKATC